MAETIDKKADAGRAEAGVAKVAENTRLKHSVELDANRTPGNAEKGAVTTRDDLTDAGVPMLQGQPDEPTGPEDAFGIGEKRGDYSERQGGVTSMEALPIERDGDIYVRDGDGNPVDVKPHTRLVPQNPRVEERGDAQGQKGGVDTDPRSS